MICSSVNLFFTSKLLSYGIGLQGEAPLKSRGDVDVVLMILWFSIVHELWSPYDIRFI